MRSSILGTILAMATAPFAATGLNGLISTTATPTENNQLEDSLHGLHTTLASFQAKQNGSERQLSEQIASLASVVADMNTSSKDQIEQLSSALGDVKEVAMQAKDTDAFEAILKDYSDGMEKRMSGAIRTLVSAEVEKAMPEAANLETLNPSTNPNSNDGRPENFADAAQRIVQLEREVELLKQRSYTTVQSQPSYTPTYATFSGGSTGSYAGSSVGSYTTYSTPQPYQYSSAQTSLPSRWFSRGFSNGRSCRVVNGVRICN